MRSAAWGRMAAAAVFFVDGAALGSWWPRIPAVREALHLTPGRLGLALLGVGLGGLVGALGVVPLLVRIPARVVAPATGLALLVVLPWVGVAPTWAVLTGVLVLAGVADGATDVSMNTLAAELELATGRSLMSGMHAGWSLGAVTGAVAATAAAAGHVSVTAQLAGTCLVLGALAVAASVQLSRTRLSHGPERRSTSAKGSRMPVSRRVLLLGLLVLVAAVVEDAPASWSAVYLRDAGAGPALAAAGLVGFSGGMTLGRLAGDRLFVRLGAAAVVRSGAVLAGLGTTVGLAVGRPVAAAIGFTLAGLGASAFFPGVFSAAGRNPDMPPAQALSFVGLLARVGFLLAPPTVGLLADRTGLRVALVLVPLAALVVAVGARPDLLDRSGTPAQAYGDRDTHAYGDSHTHAYGDSHTHAYGETAPFRDGSVRPGG